MSIIHPIPFALPFPLLYSTSEWAITDRQAAGRLEDLEELTTQQGIRIGQLTELIGRLQKENYALKSSKFQEALMRGSTGMRG
jgi:hypothetical protein